MMFSVQTVRKPDKHLLNFLFLGHEGRWYGFKSVVEMGKALSAAIRNWPSWDSMNFFTEEFDQILPSWVEPDHLATKFLIRNFPSPVTRQFRAKNCFRQKKSWEKSPFGSSDCLGLTPKAINVPSTPSGVLGMLNLSRNSSDCCLISSTDGSLMKKCDKDASAADVLLIAHDAVDCFTPIRRPVMRWNEPEARNDKVMQTCQKCQTVWAIYKKIINF